MSDRNFDELPEDVKAAKREAKRILDDPSTVVTDDAAGITADVPTEDDGPCADCPEGDE